MSCCKRKIWIENLPDLFCNFEIIPLNKKKISEQINSITRLVILIFLLILIFNIKISFIFLFISLLFIIIIYYIQKKAMNKIKENFSHSRYGPSNPKFNMCYKTPDPIFNYENTHTNYLNSKPSKDYITASGSVYTDNCNMKNTKKNTQNYIHKQSPKVTYNRMNKSYKQTTNNPNQHCNFVENFSIIEDINNNDYINKSCGYNNKNLDYNVPTNLKFSDLNTKPELKSYNEDLFTQYAGKDSLVKFEYIDPINSNIGISHCQQFPKVSSSYNNENGIRNFVYHEGPSYGNEDDDEDEDEINTTNVYDPRYNGYGTSYRGYVDKNLGQPRFYYSDIDSVKEPNYICRNNIDFTEFGDKYDTMSTSNMYGNMNTFEIRNLAEKQFLNSTLNHRDEMTQRLMRKNNSVSLQRKRHPIRTNVK